MNINDVQNTSNEQIKSSKVMELKAYAAQNSSSKDFSYYVEVSKSRDIKNQAQDNSENNNQDSTKEEVQNVLENKDGLPIYVQTFNNMNNELFDLGIANEDTKQFTDKNIFKYNIDLSDITLNDIKLFEGLAQKNDIIVNSADSTNQNFNIMLNGENLNISYRSIDISKTLFSALEQASQTGKSVRLDFGQDTSVILRISKDGKLSADFVPNEKAMETVLKNALPQLKAKFEEENIPYGELNYRSYNQNKENNQKDNKENKDE